MAGTPGSTPHEQGLAMPARFAPHERTLMTWPPFHDDLDGCPYPALGERYRDEFAAIAKAIARFEPLTMIANPRDADDARARCGAGVEVLAAPFEYDCVRDYGPNFVTGDGGRVAAVQFRFNGWGGKLTHADTGRLPAIIADHLGMERFTSTLELEGGGFTVDGEGTMITTEQVHLNANRNPDRNRQEIEREIHDTLGVERVVWLDGGLYEDTGTDGHSDNVVQFLEPGRVLLQTVRDRSNPNYHGAQENLARLKAARDAKGRKFDIVEIDLLPYTEEIDGECGVVPYVNYYPVNGGIILPALGGPEDDEGVERMAALFPDREVVCVATPVTALNGAGIGCTTMQVPAAG
jgi:agmatine deiminase